MKLKQIRMTSGALKSNGTLYFVVRVVPIKVFKHLINRFEPAQRRWYFARQHIFDFLHTLVNLRLVARISRYGVKMRGADRARVRMDVFFGGAVRPLLWRQSKSKNSPARRYFARNVNSQPVAVRNVYGLRYGHEVNIA